MSDGQTMTIDGKDYDVATLSDAAKAQIMNIQAVDQEIAQLQVKLGIAQTARAAYSQALKAELGHDA